MKTSDRIALVGVIIAAIAAVASFGQWLSPRQPVAVRTSDTPNTPDIANPSITKEISLPKTTSLVVTTQTSGENTPSINDAVQFLTDLSPQSMEGIVDQLDYHSPYSMILHIEQVMGDVIVGKLHWPDLGNSITTFSGRIASDFGDVVESSRWAYVDGYDSDATGVWLTFTENTIIQGSVILGGQYFARLEQGVLKGVWFRKNGSEPRGSYVLSEINIPTMAKTENIENSSLNLSIESFKAYPITWNGRYERLDKSQVFEMILHIEQRSSSGFRGKLHWPSIGNSITRIDGDLVTDFGGIVQESRWRYIEEFQTGGNSVWLKFTELENLQGGVQLGYQYLAHLNEDGQISGIAFESENSAEPVASFSATMQID